MKLTAPSNKSSHIHSVGYSPEDRKLGVKFHGSDKTYFYHGVSQHHYVELSTHDSTGGYFHKHILGKYPHTKI